MGVGMVSFVSLGGLEYGGMEAIFEFRIINILELYLAFGIIMFLYAIY